MSVYRLETPDDSLLLEGFSSPHEQLDDALVEGLAEEINSAVIQLFSDRFGNGLAESGADIVSTISEVLDRPTFDDIWTPAIGQCLSALRNDSEAEAERAAMALLLHLASHGASGRWRIDLASPGVFLWDAFPLPPADAFTVESDGKTTASVLCGDRRARFSRNEGGRWQSNDVAAFPDIQTDSGRVILLSQSGGRTPDCFGFELPLVLEISSQKSDALSEGLDLLRRSAPNYYHWVCRILRYLGVVKSPEDIMRSGSLDWFWGAVTVSNNQNPLSICEMLIHECSHQYFNLVSRLGEPSNNPNLYYSPFPRAQRPIKKILLGYHAFGNVFLFYRECLSDTALAAECERRMRAVQNDLSIVQDLVSDSQNWTPIGQALIRPLVRRIKNEK